MWRVSADPTRPEEAIAWFQARVPLPKEEWVRLQEAARRRAFTVAGVASLDLLAEVWESLVRALEEGTPYEEWKKGVREKLESAWGRRDGQRVETIFRTNVQMAYQSGRWAQLQDPEVRATHPYLMYDAVLDSRTTEICRARNGTVLPADHPWWSRNWPPLHFNCRSGVRPLTEAEARRRGVAQETPSVSPQPGFGMAPDFSEWGRSYARGIIDSIESEEWEPAFIGLPPEWWSYGRPDRLPLHTPPAPPLPTAKELGREGFKRALESAWGGTPLYVQDPTGATVVIDEAFIRRLELDGRERYLSWLPDLVRGPEEIWLVPMRKVGGRAVVFRVRYVKAYNDERRRNVLFVGEFQKGVLVEGYIFTGDERRINAQRQGFLRFAR
jgi:SPP1 gp7 family putative phage head morphogenesis protein